MALCCEGGGCKDGGCKDGGGGCHASVLLLLPPIVTGEAAVAAVLAVAAAVAGDGIVADCSGQTGTRPCVPSSLSMQMLPVPLFFVAACVTVLLSMGASCSSESKS